MLQTGLRLALNQGQKIAGDDVTKGKQELSCMTLDLRILK